jgi:orotate phosphoribosyltransferase/uridine monophosphate synthetase
MSIENNSRLWLADALYELTAIQFGDFTLGRTAVGSPVYINVRRLIGHPTALWRAAHVIHEEIVTLQTMRNPQVHHFDLVAGVPFGGLHIATAYR